MGTNIWLPSPSTRCKLMEHFGGMFANLEFALVALPSTKAAHHTRISSKSGGEEAWEQNGEVRLATPCGRDRISHTAKN